MLILMDVVSSVVDDVGVVLFVIVVVLMSLLYGRFDVVLGAVGVDIVADVVVVVSMLSLSFVFDFVVDDVVV